MSMILFYSDYCSHCRMLLETIKRHDTTKKVKFANLDIMRLEKKFIPSQIQSVPTLYVIADKRWLSGKQAFDYLLLPNKGKLFEVAVVKSEGSTATAPIEGEPMAFTMNGGSLSDAFSPIESDSSDNFTSGLDDRSYGWTTIVDTNDLDLKPNVSMQEETRTKKTIDIDSYKAQRDMALEKTDLNTNQLPAATFTR